MHYDVIVVGSGPSGSFATYCLASRGLKVLCVDRIDGDVFNRYHNACGECISKKAAELISLQTSEIRNTIDVFRLVWPGGVKTDIKIKGYIIERVQVIERFRRMSAEFGAVFVKGSVQKAYQIDNCCRIELNDGRLFESTYLIGADGAYSQIRRQIIGSEPDRKLLVEMRIEDRQVQSNIINFGLLGRGRFYDWVFPSGNKTSVGAVKGNLEPGEGLHSGRAIPIGWIDEFVKGNILLIGDAAGMVNPVSFGGLRIAFETAKHAADAIISSDLSKYDKWWRKSPLSDRRFMKVMAEFESYDDEQYAEFSKHLGHGLYPSGVISVLCHPSKTWLYVGCLMAIRNGW